MNIQNYSLQNIQKSTHFVSDEEIQKINNRIAKTSFR